jgi:hypothetical protein
MSELPGRRPDQLVALIGDGDVGRNGQRPSTACRYLCRSLFQWLASPGRQHHVGTVFGKNQGGSTADSDTAPVTTATCPSREKHDVVTADDKTPPALGANEAAVDGCTTPEPRPIRPPPHTTR